MAKGDLSGQALLFADVDGPAGVGAYGQRVIETEPDLPSMYDHPEPLSFEAFKGSRERAELITAIHEVVEVSADDFITPPVTRPEERPKAPPKPRKRATKKAGGKSVGRVSFVEVPEDEIGENGRIEVLSEDVLDDVLAAESEAVQPAEVILAASRPDFPSPGPPWTAWREALERAWAFNFSAMTAMSRAIKFIEAGQYPTAKVVLEVAMDDLRGQRPKE